MSGNVESCVHLSIDIVREIHTVAIAEFGGLPGVRDEGLLASAVATPQSTFGGVSVYPDLIEIAAAYLSYLCRNHAFLDGNKRTAMMSCILFLQFNAIDAPPDSADWENLVLDVSASHLDREQTTARLRKLQKKKRR
jgi:death-on-curing protein